MTGSHARDDQCKRAGGGRRAGPRLDRGSGSAAPCSERSRRSGGCRRPGRAVSRASDHAAALTGSSFPNAVGELGQLGLQRRGGRSGRGRRNRDCRVTQAASASTKLLAQATQAQGSSRRRARVPRRGVELADATSRLDTLPAIRPRRLRPLPCALPALAKECGQPMGERAIAATCAPSLRASTPRCCAVRVRTVNVTAIVLPFSLPSTRRRLQLVAASRQPTGVEERARLRPATSLCLKLRTCR